MVSVRALRDGTFTLFILSFLVFCVSYLSPYWYDNGLRNEGIWRTCVLLGETKECQWIIKDNSDAWIKGVQAMMTMALFWQFFSLIAYITWLKKDPNELRKRGMTINGKTALVFHCFSGVSIACAVIPYGSMFDSKSVSSLSWAFLLAVISGFIQLLVSVISLISVCCDDAEAEPVPSFELNEAIRT